MFHEVVDFRALAREEQRRALQLFVVVREVDPTVVCMVVELHCAISHRVVHRPTSGLTERAFALPDAIGSAQNRPGKTSSCR